MRHSLISLHVLFAGALPILAHSGIQLVPLGGYDTGAIDEDAAEIVAHDPLTQKLFIVNGDSDGVDVLDISNPDSPTYLQGIDLSAWGDGANSVDVHDGVLAIAVQADPVQEPGSVVFLGTSDYSLINQLMVGPLPDMLAFSPDGEYLLTANEGEPDADYLVDPEGSVSIIHIDGRDISTLDESDVSTATFERRTRLYNKQSIRVFGPGATPAQDYEPEYLAIYDANTRRHGKPKWKAMVTLQENNAVAILDIQRKRFEAVIGLGFKDHSEAVNALDASDEDDSINIDPWPVRGMYLPDSIVTYAARGKPYFLIANEGDAREYDAFEEETRVEDVVLDPARFPDAATLQLEENLGRLKITATLGDKDGDGDYDALYSFGGRSFSVLDRFGRMIHDTGGEFEFLTAAILPESFNSQGLPDSFDSRSDDKGPEPEGLTTAEIDGRVYAFVGLERVSGILVYDVTDPSAPFFVSYTNTSESHGDIAPEGLTYIPAEDSPNGKPLLAVGFEYSGTTRLFEITD